MRKTFFIERWLSLVVAVVVVDVVAGQAPRTGRIHITEGDPRDLTLYKGPTNDYRYRKRVYSNVVRKNDYMITLFTLY
jgi:hypothetical protein